MISWSVRARSASCGIPTIRSSVNRFFIFGSLCRKSYSDSGSGLDFGGAGHSGPIFGEDDQFGFLLSGNDLLNEIPFGKVSRIEKDYIIILTVQLSQHCLCTFYYRYREMEITQHSAQGLGDTGIADSDENAFAYPFDIR
jgi:hypothetical protein